MVTAQVAKNQHNWMFLTGLTGLMKKEEGLMNLIRGHRISSDRTIGRPAYGGKSCSCHRQIRLRRKILLTCLILLAVNPLYQAE